MFYGGCGVNGGFAWCPGMAPVTPIFLYAVEIFLIFLLFFRAPAILTSTLSTPSMYFCFRPYVPYLFLQTR